MNTPIETIRHNQYNIKIYQDIEPVNPREEFDNFDNMFCFHKRYDFGDKHDYKWENFNSWDEFKKQLHTDFNIVDILPIYMYDHSGQTISTTPFSCRWDSGQIGFIFVTKEQVKETFNATITKKLRETIRNNLLSSIKTYDQYLTGDIYGYVIENEDGDHMESCWGFYGIDYCKEEALNMAKAVETNNTKTLEGIYNKKEYFGKIFRFVKDIEMKLDLKYMVISNGILNMNVQYDVITGPSELLQNKIQLV